MGGEEGEEGEGGAIGVGVGRTEEEEGGEGKALLNTYEGGRPM